MRKINILFLCVAMVVATVGCSNSAEKTTKINDQNSTAEETIEGTSEKETIEQTIEETTSTNALVKIEKGVCRGMNVPSVYKSVLEGNSKIIVGDSRMTIEDYIYNDVMYSEEKYSYGVPEFRINSYMICNLDGKTTGLDKNDELILGLCAYDGSYAILHYEDGEVYGYDHLVARGFSSLKENGSYMRSGGAEYYDVCHMSFSKEKMVEKQWIERDGNTYKLNGKKCSEKQFNKHFNSFNSAKEVESVSFATPITIEGNDVVYKYIDNSYGTREYAIDLNGDNTDDIIKVVSDFTEYESMHEYEVYVNGTKLKSFDAHEKIGVGFLDIDSSDSITEMILYVQTYDDMEFGIYKYDGTKLVNLNESINDNHITVTPSGDDLLKVEMDSYHQDLGCFFYCEDYRYENGLLVSTNIDRIYNLNDYGAKNKYKLRKNVTLYKDSDCKAEVKTLKKNTKLTIDKVKHTNESNMNNDDKGSGYYSAAEVKVGGKIVGWIELSKKDHDWDDGMFYSDTIPAWD